MAKKQHDDFGEKIEGAKKDLWRERGLNVDDLQTMNDREADKYVKKDNIWKKPDYQAMLEDGVPLNVAYFIKKVRDAVGAAPKYLPRDRSPEARRARQEQYIAAIRRLQAIVEPIRTVEEAMKAFQSFFIGEGYIMPGDKALGSPQFTLTAKGAENPVITNKLAHALYVRSESWFNQDLTRMALDDQFGVPKEQKVPAGFKIHKFIDMKRFPNDEQLIPGTYSVSKGRVVLQTNLESREAAIRWAHEYVKQHGRNGKTRFVPEQLAHVQRDGPDYRSGQDIKGQDYLDTFGFRGGQYGNWMTQDDRQASLNMGYEALKDLASVLQISDKDIALQGDLAIAFGARGSGNAAAHYEPVQKVINLTKMHGAGSLAHEWWHAFDDFLGKKMGIRGMLSEHPHTYPLFQKLIKAIKYKEETPEQAAARVESYKNYIQNRAESTLEVIVPATIRLHEDEHIREQYAVLKAAFLSGDSDSIEKLGEFLRKVNNQTLSKHEVQRLRYYLPELQDVQAPLLRLIETDYYKDSKRMGNAHERDGGYWDSDVEMTARAFACYIKDKLAYQSDYLVGHAESAITMLPDRDGNMTIVRAYPQGEERQVINAVFDEIIADLKLQHILTHEETTQPLKVALPPPLEAAPPSQEKAFHEMADGQLSMFERPSVLEKLEKAKIAAKKPRTNAATKKPPENGAR